LVRCNGHFFTDEEHEMLTPLATHQLCVIQGHGLSVTHNYRIVTCQLCSTEDCLLQSDNCSIQLLVPWHFLTPAVILWDPCIKGTWAPVLLFRSFLKHLSSVWMNCASVRVADVG